MKNIVLLLFTIVISYAASSQVDVKAQKLLDEVSEKMNNYENIYVEFNYKLHNAEEEVNQVTRGNVTLKDDLYNVNFLGVNQLFDGKKVYTIISEDEEVNISDADAEDAAIFNNEVSKFLKDSNQESQIKIMDYLKKWADNHEGFLKISNNPKVKSLEELSDNFSNVAKLITSILKDKEITKRQIESATEYMKLLKEPVMDVELAVFNSLNDLISFSKANYLAD